MLEGITHETRAPLESMCYGGLCSLNVDKVWDLLESLSSYQWQYECASESFVCPSSSQYDLHAQSPYVDQFRDGCNHHSSYLVDVCSHCQSFNHDVNSCPYYDIFDESYVRLDAMIGTMNERHENFIREMREFGLFYETNPSLPIPRLESSLYDDYESSLPLESNVVNDAPLPDLEEVFDPSLTSLPFVAPSFF